MPFAEYLILPWFDYISRVEDYWSFGNWDEWFFYPYVLLSIGIIYKYSADFDLTSWLNCYFEVKIS